MKHLTIVVPDGQTTLSTVACIIGAYEIFSSANAYWRKREKQDRYKIELAGVSKKTDFHQGLLTMRPHVNISAIRKTQLIIVPSVEHSYQQALKGNKLLVQWIAQQYRNGAEIATMCTGTFMLASTGLLSGRNCSTHWYAADSFRQLFPDVHLQTEKLITDENGIYTNGGAYSFLNLIIYLVEKYYDRQTAIHCSKIFQVEIDRQTQSPFAIFSGQKLHSDEMIKEAQAFIESMIGEKVSVEEVSSRFAVSRRNFDRRFIKATGNTPAEYLQRVKIEAAKRAFETTRKTIYEAMYEVGYSDTKTFRDTFKKITGISPLEYRSKYSK